MIIRKQVKVTSAGATSTLAYITFGRGVFELQTAEIEQVDVPTRRYAIRSILRIQTKVQDTYEYETIAAGWMAFGLPMAMTYRRLIEGPCKLYSQSEAHQAGTVFTTTVTYRRVKK